MKKTKKVPRKSISKRKTDPKQDITMLIGQKEFWIGVATFVVLLFVGGSLVYSNFSKRSSIQAKQPSPTSVPITPEQEEKGTQMIPAIKKLANTSGFLQFFKKVASPTPTSQPQATVSNKPSSSNSTSSSPSSTTSNQTRSSAQPVRGDTEATYQEPTQSPEPTTSVSEEPLIPTQPEVEPTPQEEQETEAPTEAPQQAKGDEDSHGKDHQENHEINHDDNGNSQENLLNNF